MTLTVIGGGPGGPKALEYPEISESPRFTCALGGAYGATLATFGAVPILHSGAGCGMANAHGMTYASGLNSGGAQGTTTTPCSGLIEEHVVFGGEDKLRRLIGSTIKLMKGDLYVVISGCVPALIGDDVDSVVAEFKGQAPVIHVRTSGFAGNSYLGYNMYLDAVIDGLLEPPKAVEKRLVNILGIVPNQHVFWKGELRAIKALLEKIGVRANTLFSDFGSIGTLKRIPEASLNLVLNPFCGLAAARKLEGRFGTPFLDLNFAPVGPKDTGAFLRAVGRRLKVPARKVEAVIKEEERDLYRHMEYLAEMFMISMPHAFTAFVGDSRTIIGLLRFGANELGINPVLAVVTDDPPEEVRGTISSLLTENLEGAIRPRVVYDYDAHRIRQALKEETLQVILASSLEKYIAKSENEAFHMSISYPVYDRLVVDRHYLGFRGGISLLEDMSLDFAGPL
ncbi:MAG: nitrogenase [Deltaproteobacteria bacterium]|jgi:nitrogenase molybdenum-iron protein beta chain|nr:nitrogenase [Deltaproteobacteria bacterium]